MATKDWKKKGKGMWENKQGTIKLVIVDNELIKRYSNDYPNQKLAGFDFTKSFKSKAQALAFAKAYMRKH